MDIYESYMILAEEILFLIEFIFTEKNEGNQKRFLQSFTQKPQIWRAEVEEIIPLHRCPTFSTSKQ